MLQVQNEYVRFNGAATFQLRIVAKIIWLKSWIFSFNGAATFQLRIVWWMCVRWLGIVAASMEPQLFSCGLLIQRLKNKTIQYWLQWSRNFSVADCVKVEWQRMCRYFASMEPQLFSCGLLKRVFWPDFLALSFNGAATFQLRIARLYKASPPLCCCFNGAATFQLRIATVMISSN